VSREEPLISDGFSSREELWEFVSSDKAGEMSEKDFNLLFLIQWISREEAR
jgi:hypothetical protein